MNHQQTSIFGAIGSPIKNRSPTKNATTPNNKKSQNRSNSPKTNRRQKQIGFKDDTSAEFFVGGLNKEKTRDELFRELSNVRMRNGAKLYVKKFNMPKINAYKDDKNRIICTPGYAFVTASCVWMAQEIIKSGCLYLNGYKAEVKSVSAVKRLNSKKNEFERKRFSRQDSSYEPTKLVIHGENGNFEDRCDIKIESSKVEDTKQQQSSSIFEKIGNFDDFNDKCTIFDDFQTTFHFSSPQEMKKQ
jgi:hypothetical protein